MKVPDLNVSDTGLLVGAAAALLAFVFLFRRDIADGASNVFTGYNVDEAARIWAGRNTDVVQATSAEELVARAPDGPSLYTRQIVELYGYSDAMSDTGVYAQDLATAQRQFSTSAPTIDQLREVKRSRENPTTTTGVLSGSARIANAVLSPIQTVGGLVLGEYF